MGKDKMRRPILLQTRSSQDGSWSRSGRPQTRVSLENSGYNTTTPYNAHSPPANAALDNSDDDNAIPPIEEDDRYAGMEGLTLYEKKCVLINREIDHQGMGRYQWYIWGLCGFGYMLDLMWAQAFGLVLSPIEQEFGFGDSKGGNISTAFNSGLTAGAFVWGVLSDIVGRKWAFNLTCLFASVFGLCLGASDKYATFLVLTAFVGFGVGGNIPIDTTITLEFLPQNRRHLLACLSIFQPIGVVICSCVAFGFIPNYSCSPNFSESDPLPSCRNTRPGVPCCGKSNNMGWRYLLFTIGAITLAVFIVRFFLFKFRETPKYLVYKGRDEDAIKTIEHIAQVNGKRCTLRLEDFEGLQREHDSMASADSGKPVLGGGARERASGLKEKFGLNTDRYMMLFSSWTMTRLTILVWLTYIFDFWGFTVAGFYLPRILALKNGAANVSLRGTYAAYIYTYAPGAIGVLAGAFMYRVPSIGRKYTMVLSSGLMGASIFLLSVVDTRAKNEGLFTMEYFFQSMFNAVLYGWTPEAFPAPVRGTACGIASFWGRLFGIVSPLIAQHLYGSGGDVNGVLYLAGGVTLGCVVTTFLLPTNTIQSKDERS